MSPLRALLLAAGMAVLAAAPAQGACLPPAAYPGDAAPKERIASWMAGGASAGGQPGQLPVMGALVASASRTVWLRGRPARSAGPERNTRGQTRCVAEKWAVEAL